jgi:hypothetical protein
MKIIVNSSHTRSVCIGEINKAYNEHKFITVRIDSRKSRSLNQNALLHTWCTQVAVEEKEYTDNGVKCLCKLHIFLPILRGEDEEFNAVCESVIDPLPYESKVKAMEILPVTSLMKTKQLARGLEAMQAHYIGRVELLFPEQKGEIDV